MSRSTILAIILYIISMLLITFIKPEMLYDHELNKWKTDSCMNIYVVSMVMSVFSYTYAILSE